MYPKKPPLTLKPPLTPPEGEKEEMLETSVYLQKLPLTPPEGEKEEMLETSVHLQAPPRGELRGLQELRGLFGAVGQARMMNFFS